MTTPYFEVGCCGLKAVEQALTNRGVPVPDISQVIGHDPDLTCSCDALFVQVGPTISTVEERTDDLAGLAGMGAVCTLPFRRTELYVHLSRCVHLTNPLTGDCWGSGDCADLIRCPGQPGYERSADPSCQTGPSSKAEETAWLLEDRWIVENDVAGLWADCLCSGWCGDPCGGLGWPQVGCNARPVWQATEPFDSGGCGGLKATFTIDWL